MFLVVVLMVIVRGRRREGEKRASLFGRGSAKLGKSFGERKPKRLLKERFKIWRLVRKGKSEGKTPLMELRERSSTWRLERW